MTIARCVLALVLLGGLLVRAEAAPRPRRGLPACTL